MIFRLNFYKVEMSATSKFFYLKECLIPKLRALTNSFPFTFDRYASPNSSLLAKFIKASEVATVHMQCITSLPFFCNSYPNKINKFYEKLFFIVQVLDKMNKFGDIKV